MNKEEFEKLVTDVKGKLEKTQGALVSEDFINIMSAYNEVSDANTEHENEIAKLKKDKEELLIANGKLFQRVGIEKKVEEDKDKDKNKSQKDVVLSHDEIINKLINDKGEII